MEFKEFCNAFLEQLSRVSGDKIDPVFTSSSIDGQKFLKCTISFHLGMISGAELFTINRLLVGSAYGFYITDINGLSLVLYGVE